MLILRRVAEGGWVIGVEPSTTVGGRFVKVFFPALKSADVRVSRAMVLTC
jgi:hypothetical protein